METNLWVFKSFEGTRSFGGNEGYADRAELHYVYDSTVFNHNKVKAGDSVIIVDKKHVKGLAIIAEVIIQPQTPKRQYSCPECQTRRLASRKSLQPRYRCKNGHGFDEPISATVYVDQYIAKYASGYQAIKEQIPARLIANYYLNYNAYYSIQAARQELLSDRFKDISNLLTRSIHIPGDNYVPSISDMRDYKLLKLAIRPAQAAFRSQLIIRHGSRCMISNCDIAEALDACHIAPYLGPEDNHLENGLILRKDLHALFDADLIGIHPQNLTISVAQKLKQSSYKDLEGVNVLLDHQYCLSIAALKFKWAAFCEENVL
ncbi:HNH endonuclease [Mucilaginibacter myungsuensis]|uniref:HNH endonuclease n=1 Tax=Mucilaginibacter myungsuensis TaxID=649104 RepID=A0A929L242_9SPHI|nr:HNH endonuclease [Mucilaginibacter myungsuensis]MBE9663089.1 HNH endonuclease [Mucilaginibacter myungsuensis]MDN3598724.1 HNH endonuclease [Mucilaginibacter myungsuensis]